MRQLTAIVVATLIASAIIEADAADIEDVLSSEPFPAGKLFDFVTPDGLDTPEYLKFDRSFQTGKLCGVHALYVMLRMQSVPVNYDDLVKQCPVGPNGANLADLKRVAEDRYGFHVSLRKDVSPDDLMVAPKPIIVHLKTAPGRDLLEDHFIVVTGRNESGWLSGVDTTNGLYTVFEPAILARNMSGYCLVPENNSQSTPLTSSRGLHSWGISIIVLMVVLNSGVFLFRKSKRT